MKSIKWSNIFISICYIAAGAFFFMYPSTTEEQITKWLAYAALAIGVVDIVVYLILPKTEAFFRDDFMSGLLLITLGSLILTNLFVIVELVYIVLAIVIMISGYRKLQDCVDSWRFGSKNGFLYFILAIISVAFGLIIIIHGPSMEIVSLDYMIGAGLLYSGVTDLISAIFLSIKMMKHRKEVERRRKEAEDKKAKPEVEIVEEKTIADELEEQEAMVEQIQTNSEENNTPGN